MTQMKKKLTSNISMPDGGALFGTNPYFFSILLLFTQFQFSLH